MVHGRTLWELMERRVDATPDALMIVDEDMRTLTFAEYWAEAELAAAGLAAAGVRSGDVVSWQLPNWIETFVLVAALSRIGAVQNPVRPSLDVHQVERVATEAGSSLLVVPIEWQGRDTETEATDIARRNGAMRVLLADGALPQGDPTALDPVEEADDPEDQPVTWLFHTAGAVGVPKLARHTDASLAAAAGGLYQRLGLIAQDRHALMVPAAHVDGTVWLFASLLSGCGHIVTSTFDAKETCEVLSREGVTLAGSAPEQHRAYVDHQRRQLQPAFPDARAFVHGGTRSEPGLADDVRSLFDVPVLPSYGSTEAPMLTVASLTDHDDELRAGEGTPLPGVELRFVRPDGTIATGGAEGEIRVRAPQMMRGYTDPVLDAAAFDADGFFRTGDLGCIDDRGVVTVTGHVEDLSVRPASNVSVRDVEG